MLIVGCFTQMRDSMHCAARGLGTALCIGEGDKWAERREFPFHHPQAADIPLVHANCQRQGCQEEHGLSVRFVLARLLWSLLGILHRLLVALSIRHP